MTRENVSQTYVVPMIWLLGPRIAHGLHRLMRPARYLPPARNDNRVCRPAKELGSFPTPKHFLGVSLLSRSMKPYIYWSI
jgi:hypothetical protein